MSLKSLTNIGKYALSFALIAIVLWHSQLVLWAGNISYSGSDNISVPILMFHSINDSTMKSDKYLYKNSFSVSNLELLLKWLKERWYHSITLEKLLAWDYDKKSVLLTFDDGYADYYDSAALLLEKYWFKWVVWVITSKVDMSGYLTKRQIKDLQMRWHDMISHSVSHSEMNTLSIDKQIKELSESRSKLREITGLTSNSFIFPVWRWNSNSLIALEREWFKLAFTTAKWRYKKWVNKYLIPRMRIDNGLKVNNILSNLDIYSK